MAVAFDPASLDLKRLFVDPDMFDSRSAFRAAGFDVFERSSDNTIMVGNHKSAPGYLFKKYSNALSLKDQLKNYEQRIKGARRLMELVDDHHFKRIAVPRKWLYELPRAFSVRKRLSYVLVVERLPILDDSVRTYERIDKDTLRELCTVVFAFPGLDSNTGNVPMTDDGRVAFIDTEHWDRYSKGHKKRDKPYLRHIHKYLSDERLRFADKVFEKLEDDRG